MSEHKTGRELDALVAEKVMGLVPCQGCSDRFCHALPESPNYGGNTQLYSTDIASAWLVVEKMRERGVLIDVETLSESFRVVAGWEGRDGEDIWVQSPTYFSPSAPLAISRAALAASDASSIMKATSGEVTE